MRVPAFLSNKTLTYINNKYIINYRKMRLPAKIRNGGIQMKEIKRNLYLNKLIERKENDMIKVITGIRRCGKSYLLFTLYYNYLLSIGIDESRIIKVDLDSEEHEDLLDAKKLGA